MGCDNILNYNAREDVCGICNGDGSTATTVSDSATGFSETSELFSNAISQQYVILQLLGYVDVGTIPIGAREITIRETSPAVVIGSYNT